MYRPLPARPAALRFSPLLLMILVALLFLPVATSASGRAMAAADPIALLAQDPTPPGSPNSPPSVEIPQTDDRATFLQLGYPDQTITAGLMTSVVDVPLRPSQTIGLDSQLILRFEASPLLDHLASSLTVSVNGEVRQSTSLAEANGDVAELLVPLEPTDRLPETASFVLTIETRLVTPNVGCPPAIDPGRWLVIRADSSITFQRTNLDQSAGLADLPNLFMPATPDPIGRAGDIRRPGGDDRRRTGSGAGRVPGGGLHRDGAGAVVRRTPGSHHDPLRRSDPAGPADDHRLGG